MPSHDGIIIEPSLLDDYLDEASVEINHHDLFIWISKMVRATNLSEHLHQTEKITHTKKKI